jgi:nicotinamide-nucleotide amidase
VTAYDNAVKMRVLGVSPQTLEHAGAVSEETAIEMARGARQALGADVGVSSTGIAGPTGATARKPIGLVWIGIATVQSVVAHRLDLRGDRSFIQARASAAALGLLWRALARERI